MGDVVGEEFSDGLAGALLGYDAVRSTFAKQAETEFRPKRSRADVLNARDVAMLAEMHDIHDAISEADQLRVYRFFLTAVHRNSVAAHRFDSVVMVSPDRTAALEAEFHEVSNQLTAIVDDVATQLPNHDAQLAHLLASSFLWSMAWWIHSRVDVLSFAPRLGDEDVLVSLLLGQSPNPDERVVGQIYQCATKAELAYRRMLMVKPVELSQQPVNFVM